MHSCISERFYLTERQPYNHSLPNILHVALYRTAFTLFFICVIVFPEPVFVNLCRSPGIDSQPDGPVRQPYLSYRPAMLHRQVESNPRTRFLVSLNVYKYGLCLSHNPPSLWPLTVLFRKNSHVINSRSFVGVFPFASAGENISSALKKNQYFFDGEKGINSWFRETKDKYTVLFSLLKFFPLKDYYGGIYCTGYKQYSVFAAESLARRFDD